MGEKCQSWGWAAGDFFGKRLGVIGGGERGVYTGAMPWIHEPVLRLRALGKSSFVAMHFFKILVKTCGFGAELRFFPRDQNHRSTRSI